MTLAIIRDARPEDAGRLLEIYAYYIEHTAITFEYVVPAAADFQARIRHTLERYPYLVAEKDGKIAGYAYAGPFKERAAYDWACELSIYLDQDVQKQGLGRMLYEALEERLRAMGILNLYACIACPQMKTGPVEASTEALIAKTGPVEASTEALIAKTGPVETSTEALTAKSGLAESSIDVYTAKDETFGSDPFLNWNSVDFHVHLGYRIVGTFHKCGYKFGRWYDMVWMEKMIGAHGDEQAPVRFGR